jgi:hypothetical protein
VGEGVGCKGVGLGLGLVIRVSVGCRVNLIGIKK